MIDLKQADKLFQRQPGNSLLGLAFDGGRLEIAHVRRINGSVEIKSATTATLALDPLTAEVELAGRELRKELDARQIRERWCVIGLPLNWALTLTVSLPDIPESDVADFLQLEAERGFPQSPEELILAHSRFTGASGARFATLMAAPRAQITRLESVLQAAQLRPVSFSLGIAALQSGAENVLALWPGVSGIAMLITAGGGINVLRAMDGAFEQAGARRELQADVLRRELRITLGQLPSETRDQITLARVIGGGEEAADVFAELEDFAADRGMRVEQRECFGEELSGLKLPAKTNISAAVALAVRRLGGWSGPEFLPPKISQWQQITERYSSGKLFYAGAAAGTLAALVLLAFLIQQILLWHWQSKWAGMEKRASELAQMRDDIRQYRPWFEDSVKTLAILKRLTEAFPQDGAVSAKTLELREPARVTCSGTARNREAFIAALEALRKGNEVADVHIEATRGSSPLEFTFNFQWRGPGAQ
jgi:hypothetical protein